MIMLTSTHERILSTQLDRLEGVVAELLERNAELTKLVARRDPLTKVLLDRLEDLMDRQQEMVGTVHHHQVRQFAVPTTMAPVPTETPNLYTSEDEADLQYMKEQGLIEPHELEQALREMNFANDEIRFE